jgi:uncharacterized BrkB/YihY/UPF0761 family membrane protein
MDQHRIRARRGRVARDVSGARLVRHQVADYGSIFGALAAVWIVLTYLYLAAIAFLTGAEVDTVLREQAR